LISGTPSYMTPEHLRAQAAPNPLLDLWGLAATAFAALTATVPFDGDTLSEIMKKLCVAPLPLVRGANGTSPGAIDAWFAKACARAPAARFQTAAELTSAFSAACAADAPASDASFGTSSNARIPVEHATTQSAAEVSPRS
jgi:serine/threonine-protein kinase